MYTHCPHCDTYFRITSAQLKSANGNVRCGRCFGAFNALRHLVDEPPRQADKPAPMSDTLTEPKTTPQPGGLESTQAPTTAGKGNFKREHSQQLIDELQGGETGLNPSKRHLWALLSLPLAVLLLMQYSYFNLGQLAQQSQYRPALEILCKLTGCEVPLLRAPQQFTLVQRDIRAHQSKSDILVVKAVIHNQAGFAQPFPVMQLSMQDITGHTMTGRRFLPREYLVDATLNLDAGIGPNQSQQIMLELVDPGEEAVGFEFEFL